MGTVLFLGVVPTNAQQPSRSPHDLSALVKLFDDHSKDFNSMEKTAQGEEFETLDALNGAATTAEERLAAADAELRMYDSITCKADRQTTKRILIERLNYYVWGFDKQITFVNGTLTFVKAPAEAQAGLQMKNDMRTAKEKLEAILASLQ
jgi:hypothetical protein